MLSLILAASLTHPVYLLGSKNTTDCDYAYKPFVEIVSRMDYPADWKFAIACTDAAWQEATISARVKTDYGFTVLPARITVINGRMFDHLAYRGTRTPEQTLKHELGHVRCQCADEDIAEGHKY